jgi:hypothetical protein
VFFSSEYSGGVESSPIDGYCDACVKVIRSNPGALCKFTMLLPDGKRCLGFCCTDEKPEPFPDLPADFPF